MKLEKKSYSNELCGTIVLFKDIHVNLELTSFIPFHGTMVDLFEKKGLLTKSGNRLKYVDASGKEHLEYRKAWTGERLELIMQEISNITPQENPVEEVSTVDVTEGE